MLMNKVKNFKSTNESRLIFNYSKIIENLLDIFVKLFSKMHDNLLNLKHRFLFLINLKHVYYIINMHSENKHYFVFIIFEIN